MAVEREIKITYTMSSLDYAATILAISRQTFGQGVRAFVLWLLAGWLAATLFTNIYDPILLLRWVSSSALSILIAVMLVIVLAALTVAHRWFLWAISLLYYRRTALADATVTVSLTEAGIESTSVVADTRIPWSTVKRVVRDRDHLVLAISRYEAVVLPRRAFANETDFDEAYTFTSRRRPAS